ncbi:Uncharacterised protein [Vibrio cholerae]|nr:Uncharacterised protein [Vibrio cholerae]
MGTARRPNRLEPNRCFPQLYRDDATRGGYAR